MTRTSAKVTKRNMICSAMLICLAWAATLPAFAADESDAVRAIYLSAATVPTNLANIHTYAEPPKGFNPVTATDIELATYGFPQRPDKQADPDHYATWERAMLAAKIRWNGELKPLHVSSQRTVPAGSSPAPENVQPQTGPSHQSNISAAGVTLSSGRTTWSNSYSFNYVSTVVTVPSAELPLANSKGCTASDYLAVSLVGIDGQVWFGANGVPFFIPEENAGVYEDYSCSYGASYIAYAGWENSLNGLFYTNPGDLVFVVVEGFGGCNNGYTFVQDLTTYTYSSYTIPNPCSVSQIGRYANWAVWRPCCDGPGPDGAWPLANTVGTSFDQAVAQIGSGKQFFPGSQAASTQILTMRDDGSTQNIEVVNQGSTGYQGQRSLYLQTWGCAYYGGCNP